MSTTTTATTTTTTTPTTPPKQTSKNSLALNMTLGGTAACVAGLFTNPMETVKVRFQLQRELAKGNIVYKNMADCFAKMWRYEGISGLQGGLSAALLYQLVMNSIRIGCFETVTNLPQFSQLNPKDSPILNSIFNFFVGGVFGGIGALCGAPLFCVKTRLQVANRNHLKHPEFTIGQQYGYTGTFDGLKKMYQDGAALSSESSGSRVLSGITKGLWANATVSAARVFMGGAVQLSAYENCKYIVQQYTNLDPKKDTTKFSLLTSLLSALLVTIAMNPFDVVVSRMNNQDTRKGVERKYTSAFDCFIKIGKTEGIRGYCKGFIPHLGRLGPHVVLTFTTYEFLKKYFIGETNKQQLINTKMNNNNVIRKD